MRIEGVKQVSQVKDVRPVDKEPSSGTLMKVNFKEEILDHSQNEKQGQVTEEELINSIEKANEKFELYDKRLEFSIHEKTKEIMVKIIDTKNDEVIREIPPEKILDMVAKMMEWAGLLVDEKA